jgi:hypothetical protein
MTTLIGKRKDVFLESNNTSRSRKTSKSTKRSKSNTRRSLKVSGKNPRELNLKNVSLNEYTSVTVSLLNNKLQVLNSIFSDYEVNVKELGNHSKSTQGIADYFIFKLNELIAD